MIDGGRSRGDARALTELANLHALGLDPALFEPRREDRFDLPYRFPYQLGLFMAVNAIPGCFVVIDGPDCIYRKAEWIHGRHDLRSTLLDAGGRHRVVSTLMHSGEVIKSEGEAVVKRLRRVAQLPEAELALVCSMPHVQIIGTQYDALIASVEGELPLPIYEVPSRSLESDWLGGYAEVLSTLARRLAPPPEAEGLVEDEVAIIGLLMDRTEADHLGNVAELERLVADVGLRPVSTWLSDRPLAHLRRALTARYLLALPHGVDAARLLARRSGATVIEVEQPFGLQATARMLMALGEASGRERAARAVIERELRAIVPRFEWLIPSFLARKRVAFSGDPTLFDGLLEGLGELGMRPLHLSAPALRPEYGVRLDSDYPPTPPVLFAPGQSVVRRQLEGICASLGLDLIIGGHELPVPKDTDPWQGSEREKIGRLHFGFPNFFCHAIHDSPFLGFQGWAWFIQEIARTIGTR
ncbi:hypothetical protein G6O69_38185 [Pseudenhygromyxa sp. WMMC2535]|uniref:nitrogenase component 1 n=1 Tax=Pseudenhygromyxa sp. WMMC2535 TaxID=2712867 RepID=UPI0015548786|nr:nitrogenase component 1 [Pseudenhygromyxa sp. WMMC2535]NVB41387.1 hypothetical protein [Pseudenhygromyxa sp. WMMC2535]NVB43697.1 hypothetical protein [Pseudenhygromyxa sp. WMMC2535]